MQVEERNLNDGKDHNDSPGSSGLFFFRKPFSEWKKIAHWEFVAKSSTAGTWNCLKKGAPDSWSVSYQQLKFQLHLTKFKHVGLFPEQRSNWDFIRERLSENDRFLNLFAYTGAATCVARDCRADALHVDSVKQLIGWARENMELSHLADIRWVHEDALKFAQREVKRGNQYKGIVMDPPAWGIGAKKEKWKLEDRLDELVGNASQLIETNGFLVLNTYSPKVDLKLIQQLAEIHFANHQYTVKELWMKTTTGKDLYYGNVLRVG